MTPTLKLRACATFFAAIIAAIAVGNLVAECIRGPVPPIALRSATASTAGARQDMSALAAAIAPLRSDVRADHALVLANNALAEPASAGTTANDAAQTSLRDALSVAPGNSRLWAALAALRARRDTDDPQVVELLKLSYYTGPHDLEIIPLRLDIALSDTALSDTELRELARGDVSAVLSANKADGLPALNADYSRASAVGKAFLGETVSAINPALLDGLRRTPR